jgi:ribose/xylose/arabinose/galactoside ABC-type transport system permease subunit
MLGIGLLIGAINGALISGFRMPAFIVTLSSMMFFNGVALWITKSKNIYSLPEPFLALGQKPMVLVPLSLGLAVIAHILLTRFLHGRWFHAIGHNPVASAISGVPVRRTTILVYMLSGLFAAASSVLLTAKLETGSAVIGRYVFLDVIGAAVIGGTSLFGGKGSIRGTAFGVLFIAIIGNSLDLLGLSQFAILIIKGMVVLVAALVDAERNRMLTGRSGK